MVEALLLAGGVVLLFAGGEALVRGAGSLGLRIGLSPLVVGLTLIAFGTSTPELAVSLRAALRDLGGIALGNVVGSNICNIALILGLSAIVRPITVHAQLIRIDVPLMVAASLLLCVLLAGGQLGRTSGIVLVLGIAAYTVSTLVRARRESVDVRQEFESGIPAAMRARWLDPVLVAVGLAGLFVGSDLFVNGAVRGAEALGVDRAVIGLTIVAVGTSLPELASSVVAAMRGSGDIAIGNVVGSNLFNILGILGATALIHPISPGGVGWVDLGVMVGFAFVLYVLVRLRSKIDRASGVLLLLGYAGYVYWLVP